MQDKYFYLDKKGQQMGPVSPELFKSLGIGGETMVWKRGMSMWKKANQVYGLSTYMKNDNYHADHWYEDNNNDIVAEKTVDNKTKDSRNNVWECIKAIFKVVASVFCVLFIILGFVLILIGQSPALLYYGKNALSEMWNLGWEN